MTVGTFISAMPMTLAVAMAALSTVTAAQQEAGTICIAPVRTVPDRGPADPALACNSGNFSFRIDDRPIQKWSKSASVKIDQLDLDVKHRIRTYCDGKPHQTFSFHFSDYKSTTLCFFLNDLYLTPQLWERAPWCKCK